MFFQTMGVMFCIFIIISTCVGIACLVHFLIELRSDVTKLKNDNYK